MRRRMAAASVESWSWWTARARGHEQDAPAGVAQALAEVGLVRVDEEVRVEPAHLLGRLAPHEHRARLHPADLAHARRRGSATATRSCRNTRGGERPAGVRQPPGAGGRLARAGEQLRARRGGARVGLQRVEQRARRALAQLGVLVEQQAVAAARLAQQRASRSPPCRVRRSRAIRRASGKRSRTASAEPSSEALSSTSTSCATPGGWVRSIASRQASRSLAAVRVDDAVGQLGQRAGLLEHAERARGQLVAVELALGERPRVAAHALGLARGGRAARRASSARSRGVAGPHVQPGVVLLDELAHPAVHVHDRRPPGGEGVEQLVGRVGGQHRHVLEERQAGARARRPARPPPPCRAPGPGNARWRAPRSSSARRLPSPISTKATSGSSARRLDRRGQVVGLAHRAEVAHAEALGRGRGPEQVEVGGVRHQRHLLGGRARRRPRRRGCRARGRSRARARR